MLSWEWEVGSAANDDDDNDNDDDADDDDDADANAARQNQGRLCDAVDGGPCCCNRKAVNARGLTASMATTARFSVLGSAAFPFPA